MKIKFIFTAALMMLLSSCYSYNRSMADYTLPSNGIDSPTKIGKACNDDSDEYFLQQIFFGKIDLSVETARINGDITNILSIEKEVGRGLFPRICIVVKGT